MYNKFKVTNWPKLDSIFKFLLEFWKLPFYFLLHKHPFIVCFHDVMVAIFVSQNNETAAMFVSQISPVGKRFLLFQ